MMEVYRTPSKDIQEIILANVTYEAVIEGLNGYFASEPRNDYITVKFDHRTSALYEAEAWADILIEWLRKKHDIFYRPGLTLDQVEAARNAAKTCCLRAHINDEISKRGLWCDKDADIPELVDTLFKAYAYDECKELRDINRKDAVTLSEVNQELKKELNALKDTVSKVRSRLNKKFCTLGYEDDLEKLADIAVKTVEARDEMISRINVTAHKEVKQECYDYLWNALKELSPDCDALRIDRYEDLVDWIFYEMSIIEVNCKKCQRCHSTEKFNYIRRTNKAEEELKKLKEKLDKATADYQALSEENQKHKKSVFDLEKTCYREICDAKGIELDDAFLYSDDYTWEDLVGFLCEEIRKLKKEIKDAQEAAVCKDIMKYIRYEASRNGFELPEEIDGEPLTIKRVFHDLLELLRKRDTEIRNAKQEARKAVNEQLKKDTDYVADTLCDILEALGISKSNTAHLDIPGLKTKALQRASLIKSEHGRYQEQLGKAAADYQALSEENQKLKSSVFDIESTLKGVLIDTALEKKIIDSAAEEELRNSIFHDVVRVICQECYDRGLQKSDINKLIRDCCTKHGIIAPSRYLSDEACVEYLFSVIEQKIENYKLKLKDYILKDIKKHGYRYDSLETKSIEEIVDRIVTIATCTRNEWVDSEIRNLRGQIDRLKGLINAMNEEVKDM